MIEGGDGAGKDTQVELLKKEFYGESFVYTRDPGGTELGTAIREMLQYGTESISHDAELFLFLASRAQLVHEIIRPTLEAGKNVISTRFDLSTLAYQLNARERTDSAEFLLQASSLARGGLTPDLTVLLDVPSHDALSRLSARGEKLTRFEKETEAFHEKVRQGYLAAAKDYPNVVVVDASRWIGEVYADVKAAVSKTLGVEAPQA